MGAGTFTGIERSVLNAILLVRPKVASYCTEITLSYGHASSLSFIVLGLIGWLITFIDNVQYSVLINKTTHEIAWFLLWLNSLLARGATFGQVSFIFNNIYFLEAAVAILFAAQSRDLIDWTTNNGYSGFDRLVSKKIRLTQWMLSTWTVYYFDWALGQTRC